MELAAWGKGKHRTAYPFALLNFEPSEYHYYLFQNKC